ncbi:hypothetical protein M5K25_022803 [Dendrobium thyrsiflorum]|uniref:Uncharacterized protein n=1 Tax=Dendrobium thyrsiflorum TaxID=117978 RepID=A0ABD0U6V0_DENTH
MSPIKGEEGRLLWDHMKVWAIPNSDNTYGGEVVMKISSNCSKHRVGKKRKSNGDRKRPVASKCGGENIEDVRIYEESNHKLHIYVQRGRKGRK